MSAVYELPFGQGKHMLTSGPGKWILGGWQVNALWSWESGLPLDISTSPASFECTRKHQSPQREWAGTDFRWHRTRHSVFR